MVIATKELLRKGETQYSIKQKLKNKELFLLQRGIYVDEPVHFVDEQYICIKYSHAIITGLSAFYYYDLTTFIPEKFYLATMQHSFPIRNASIIQSYQNKSIFYIGKHTVNKDGQTINIYDLERTLIELIRLKEKYPSEIYYEVINSYRKIKNNLDFYKINEYAKHFRNGGNLIKKIKEII